MISPFQNPIYVTRPLVPNYNELEVELKKVLESGQLANHGPQLDKLEANLKSFLKVNELTLFCNGTLALQLACKVLDLKGEVITTPFTFPATPHSISLNGLTPVFCDIEEETLNIDASKIEALITPRTSAIMPVHVFGNPCDINKIEEIAKKHNLKVIYDAAHAFGVEVNGESIGNFGDISMFSFHATKLFNTIEGGALTYGDKSLTEKLYYLKNFGIKNEEEVPYIGLNAKMNEIQALFGNLLIGRVDEEIEKRTKITMQYRMNLEGVKGVKVLAQREGIKYNYQYMPILIDENTFGLSRNFIYEELKKYNVFARKYFYPLCSNLNCYKDLPSSDSSKLKVSEQVANQVLCLPIFGELQIEDVNKICEIIQNIQTTMVRPKQEVLNSKSRVAKPIHGSL